MYTSGFARDRYGLPIQIEKSRANSDSRSSSKSYLGSNATLEGSNTPTTATLSSQVSMSTTANSNTSDSGTTTTTAASRSFMGFPGEIRNTIYEYCLASYTEIDDRVIQARKILRGKHSSDQQLNVALELAQAYPFLLTSKTVMQGAFQACLCACTLNLDLNRDDDVKLDKVFEQSSDISPLLQCTKYIRSASILLSRPGRSLFSPRIASLDFSWTDKLKALCPNLEKLEFHLTDGTHQSRDRITSFFSAKDSIAGWLALRTVVIRHLDLEKRVRKEQSLSWFASLPLRPFFPGREVLFAGAPWYNRQPWQMDMDVRFMERVNEDLAKVLMQHRAIQAKEANGEDGDDA